MSDVPYWCHRCGHRSPIEVINDIKLCTECNSDFIEEIRHDSVRRAEEISFSQPVPVELARQIMSIIQNVEDREIMGLRSQESLERISNQSFEEDKKITCNPASEDFLNNLTEVMLSDKELKEECAICHDNYTKNLKGVKLPCSHIFHKDCITLWLKNHNTCPICKRVY